MAQGKLKVKAKLPANVKQKKVTKGGAVTKRNNCPKKKKINEAHKIRQKITKTINKAIEEEIRCNADDGKKNLSKAQKAVVAHHSAM